MKHKEVIKRLPELGAGVLAPEVTAGILAHARQCRTCSEWLSAHDLLASGLQQDQAMENDHPSADLLALCTLRPEEINEPGRDALRSHLEHCGACRGTIALVRDAVWGARPIGSGAPNHPRIERPSPRRRALLAASLVLALLGAGLVLSVMLKSSLSTNPTTLLSHGQSSSVPSPGDTHAELSGHDLDGTHVIQADHSLTVSRLMVRNGADVTFDAGGRIAFGDGFRVEKGGRIKVRAGHLRAGHAPTNRSGKKLPARTSRKSGAPRATAVTSSDQKEPDRQP